MAQLIVRNLDAAVVRRLRSRASTEGISVEEAHRRVLREALICDPAPARKNFLEYLRTMPDIDLPLARARELPREVTL